jgi:hypothetical protein
MLDSADATRQVLGVEVNSQTGKILVTTTYRSKAAKQSLKKLRQPRCLTEWNWAREWGVAVKAYLGDNQIHYHRSQYYHRSAEHWSQYCHRSSADHRSQYYHRSAEHWSQYCHRSSAD